MNTSARNLASCVTLALTLISGLYATAETACKVEQSVSPSGDKRFFSVHYPNGRTIKVVGHNHGLRTVANKLYEEEPGPDYLKRLKAIIESEGNPVYFRHAREDVEFLRKELKEGKTDFVAIETSPESAHPLTNSTLELYGRMIDHSIRSKRSHTRDISDILLRHGQAIGYLATYEPGLFKNVKIVGFENAAFADPDVKASQALEEAFHQVAHIAQGDAKMLDWLGKFQWAILFELYPAFRPDDNQLQPQVLEGIRAVTEPKYHAHLETVLQRAYAYFKTLHKRDTFTAWRMHRSDQSGVLFVGATHATPLAMHLVRECEEDQKKLERGQLLPISSEGTVR